MQIDYSSQLVNKGELCMVHIYEPKSSKEIQSRPKSSKKENFSLDKIQFKSDFDFKHVSKLELESVLKYVRRKKKKQQDEENWNFYVKSRLEKNAEENLDEKPNNLIYSNGIGSCEECKLMTLTEGFFGQSSDHQEESVGRSVNMVPEEMISAPSFRNSIDTNQSHNYQLGPGLTKRLQDLLDTVRKMTTVLLSPCLRTQNEDEDVDRTIKRSLEFDAMFARNHLYEIQRLLKDTKKMMAGKTFSAAEAENKILATLKSVAQALQVYTKHVSKGSRVKYQQIVPIFQCIATTQSVLENLSGQRLFPMRHELEVSCSYLKQVLLEMSATETRSVTTVSHKAPKIHLKKKPSADLTMYSRRHKDWRKKTATLARARFGPPSSKKHLKKSESAVLKDTCGVDQKNVCSKGDIVGTNTDSKTQIIQSKDSDHSKEPPFRNATRAVPEEQVSTMMEMIPHEEHLVTTIIPQEDDVMSNLKSAKEVNNVQLVCVMERSDRRNTTSTRDNNSCGGQIQENACKTVTMVESERAESLEYKKKMADYQESSPLYKDDKALGIIDRLASHFLKEMLIDFQQNEMDQVIRTLYNLEFE